MEIFIFIIIVVVVVIVYLKHAKKQELLKNRAAFEERQIKEDKKNIWGGTGVSPYRNATQAPEKHLKEIADLIDNVIGRVCKYQALYEYPDDVYSKSTWGRRVTYWSAIQYILMSGLKEAEQDKQIAEKIKAKADNTYQVAAKFADTIKFDMINSVEYEQFIYPLQEFISEQSIIAYSKGFLRLSRSR